MYLTLLIPVLLAAASASQTAPLLQKGLLDLQHGDLPAARSELETASQADPANPYVWATLAEVYARQNETKLASNAAQRAEKTGPGNPVVAHALALYYVREQDFANAARLEEHYAASPKADHDSGLRAAGWYALAGNPDKALALGSSLARDSGQVFELAQLMLRQQHFRQAADLLSTGLAAHPHDAQLTLALGAARYGQRRFPEAITAFIQVIHTAPGVPQSYLFLSKMLDQAGPQLPEIASLTGKWASENPRNAAAQLVLAKVLLAQDPASPRAPGLLRQSIELDPKNWDSHYQLGLVLEQTHQYPAAAKELETAATLSPEEAMPHYHLARVYDRLGRAQDAAEQRTLHQKLIGPASR